MDALSEVLKVLRLTSGLFLDAEFTAPWCIDSAPGKDDVRHILPDAEHVSIYHLLTEGRCRALLPGTGESVVLEEGDLIMFPHGDGHRLGSDLQLAPVGAEVLVEPSPEGGLARIKHGGGGERTRFVCGFLACDKRLCRPLLGALPRMLRVELGDGPAAAWITATLRHGASETHAPRPGSDALLGRLSELLFVEAIRHYTASLPQERAGLARGAARPVRGQGARAPARRARPGAGRWRSSPGEAGISRSALNERFNALIGEPPMQYLTGWRLALASQALASSNDAVVRIAERVGYDSEAAFNRAFKREFGVPPAAWRRSVRATRNRGNADPGERSGPARRAAEHQARDAHRKPSTAGSGRWPAAGLREIEVASFVPPKLLPQMADAAEVVREALKIPGLTVLALVPNLRGVAGRDRGRRAQGDDAGVRLRGPQPDEPAEERGRGHRRKSARRSCEFRDALPDGRRARGSRSASRRRSAARCRARCPRTWSSRWRCRLAEAGVDSVGLSDTTGYANPGAGEAHVPAPRRRARATAWAARTCTTRAGRGSPTWSPRSTWASPPSTLRRAASAAAPTRRARRGNIVTEDLVFLLESMGLDTGIDIAKLIAAREAPRRGPARASRSTATCPTRGCRRTSVRAARGAAA